jgi:hypothetical protein
MGWSPSGNCSQVWHLLWLALLLLWGCTITLPHPPQTNLPMLFNSRNGRSHKRPQALL